MHLQVLTPTDVIVDTQVTKIVAEADNGAFCLLPRHIDFLTALVPGILSYTLESNQEIFMAINEGILIKCGNEVFIATLQAMEDNNLETLKETVESKFKQLDEKEKLMRSALAKFEAVLIRRFQKSSL